MKFNARSEFSSAVRVEAFARAGGRCELCTVHIRPGNGPHYDHVVPASIGGSAELSNCQVLCRSCHSVKTTKTDVPEVARTKRLYKSRINARDRRGPVMAGSKASKWKRKINGEIERR